MSYKKKSNYSNYSKKNTKYQSNDPIKQLMYKHNIDRTTATQIESGVISIEMWQQKREEEKLKMEEKEQFIAKLNQFSPDAGIDLENCLDILKGVFEDPVYKNQKKTWLLQEKNATTLANEQKIPVPIARSIVNKKFSLEEYLEKEKEKKERREQAMNIHKNFPDIPMETCYKLVDENVKPEDYYQFKSKKQEKRGAWYKSYLEDNLPDNEPLNNYLEKLRKTKTIVSFHLYGIKSIVGTIYSYTPYEIKVHVHKKLVTLHKLEIKYFHRQRNDEHILKSLQVDHSLQKNPVLPNPNTKERFAVDKDISDEQKIKITLGEGEQINGFIDWVSKYDIKLKMEKNSNISVMLFKHAIVTFELV